MNHHAGQHTPAAHATAVAAQRDAHGLARDLVNDDEVILLLLRPSPSYIVLSSVSSLTLIALLTLTLAYLSHLPFIGWKDAHAFALGALLTALRLGWQTLDWLGRIFILTDRRVITRAGVLRVSVFQTTLKNIQHTSVFTSVRERLFGLGSIGFATAGSDLFETFWVTIRTPFAVHRTIVEAIRRYSR